MVRAKNYETVSTYFVEVMRRKLWPPFFRTRCRYNNDDKNDDNNNSK